MCLLELASEESALAIPPRPEASVLTQQWPASPELAVVIPVLNEADNVAPLVERLTRALASCHQRCRRPSEPACRQGRSDGSHERVLHGRAQRLCRGDALADRPRVQDPARPVRVLPPASRFRRGAAELPPAAAR